MSTLLLTLTKKSVDGWVYLYTAGLPGHIRDRRVAEIDSDLWEEVTDRSESGSGRWLLPHLLIRMLLGVPSDVLWRLEAGARNRVAIASSAAEGRTAMSTVVSSEMVPCPSCGVHAIIRIWACGCQGVDYPDHLDGCKAPDGFFDPYRRFCQELQDKGPNPQLHLVVRNL